MTDGDKVLAILKETEGGIAGFSKRTKKQRSYYYSNISRSPLSAAFLKHLRKYGIEIDKVVSSFTPAALIGYDEIVITLRSGKKSILYLPKGYSKEDIEHVMKVLKVHI